MSGPIANTSDETDLGVSALAGAGLLLVLGMIAGTIFMALDMANSILTSGFLLNPPFVGFVYGTTTSYITYRLYAKYGDVQ